MNKIKVSIVMPVLNGMPYFVDALESLCNQSLSEIEILVVDGGSIDGTREYLIQKMKVDDRVQMIESDMKSMGRQYNLGIQNASGEYIGFCESDDLTRNNMFSDLYEYASKNEDVDFVKSDFEMFIGEGESYFCVPYNILPKSRNDLYNKKISLNEYSDVFFRDINMWNGIYKKSFILQNSILLNETKGAAFQDTDFVQQVLFAAKKMLYVSVPSYLYRRDNDASSVYKDTAIFVANELYYMLKLILQNGDFNDNKIEMVTNRLFNFYCDRLGRSLFLDLTTIKEKYNYCVIDALQEIYSEVLGKIPKTVSSKISNSILFDTFMNDREFFYYLCEKLYKLRWEYLQSFGEIIKENNMIFIFGAGELGIATLALLKNNKCEAHIKFMDNSIKMWGKKVCGIEVVPPEECKEHKDSLYILSRNIYCQDIEQQLREYGVRAENIFIQPEIGIHSSLELKY